MTDETITCFVILVILPVGLQVSKLDFRMEFYTWALLLKHRETCFIQNQVYSI